MVKWRILTNWLGVIRKWLFFFGLSMIPFEKGNRVWKANPFKSDSFQKESVSKMYCFWAQKGLIFKSNPKVISFEKLNTSWFKFPLILFESKLLEFEVPNMKIEINGLLYHKTTEEIFFLALKCFKIKAINFKYFYFIFSASFLFFFIFIFIPWPLDSEASNTTGNWQFNEFDLSFLLQSDIFHTFLL